MDVKVNRYLEKIAKSTGVKTNSTNNNKPKIDLSYLERIQPEVPPPRKNIMMTQWDDNMLNYLNRNN